MGTTGPTGPTGPFLSSYIEASGDGQLVGNGGDIVFDVDPDSLDVVGGDITLDPTGTIFTINRPGLYHVEWDINLGGGTQPILLCLRENGAYASAISSAASSGNCSSGALIHVTSVPYTVSLHNFGGPISLVEPVGVEGAAASIRILRFADGPVA